MVVSKKLHLAYTLRQNQSLERLAANRLDGGADSGLALRALEGAQVLDQGAHISVVQRKRRHPDLGFSAANDLHQFVVIQGQQTRGDRRPMFPSLHIASVAGDAVLKLLRVRSLVLSSDHTNSRQQTRQAQETLSERHGTEHITWR